MADLSAFSIMPELRRVLDRNAKVTALKALCLSIDNTVDALRDEQQAIGARLKELGATVEVAPSPTHYPRAAVDRLLDAVGVFRAGGCSLVEVVDAADACRAALEGRPS